MNKNPIRVTVVGPKGSDKLHIARPSDSEPYVFVEAFVDEVPELINQLHRVAPTNKGRDATSDLYDAEQELVARGAKIRELEAEVAKYKNECGEMAAKVEVSERESRNARASVTKLDEELKKLRDSNASTERDLSRALGYIDHVNELAYPNDKDRRFRGPMVSDRPVIMDEVFHYNR